MATKSAGDRALASAVAQEPLVGSGLDVIASTPEPVPPTAGRAGTRAVAAVVDEGLSSLQNFVILFAALHYLNVSEIGTFTLSYTSVFLAEMLLKFLLLVPLSVNFSHATRVQQRVAGSQAVGSSVLCGFVLLALAVGGGFLMHGENRVLLVAGGLAVLGVIPQEAWRSYFFTIGRPWQAVVNEIWCLIATLALTWFYVIRSGQSSPDTLILLLGIGTAVGFVVGCLQTRILPSVVPGGMTWLREHWHAGIRLAGSRGATQIAGRVSLAVISSIAGTAALGQLSASRTLMTPATTVLTSSMSYAVPEATRLYRREDQRLDRFLVTLSLVLGVAIAVLGLGISQLPDQAGRIIAGHNWELAKQLLLPVIVFSTANSLQQGANVGLIVRLRPGWTLRISLANGAAVLIGAGVGASLGAAQGAAWGLAIAQVASIPLWWIPFRHLARSTADVPATGEQGADAPGPERGRHRIAAVATLPNPDRVEATNGHRPTEAVALSPPLARRSVRASRPDPTWAEDPLPAQPVEQDLDARRPR